MRRGILALALTAAMTLATALPVASSGLTQVTVSCNDGTSFAAAVDADTLTGLIQSIEAMTLYPAGLSCTLVQQLPLLGPLGGLASAWPGGGFIVGGGRFMAGCPGGLGLFWINFAVSAHTTTDAPGDVRGGTLNFTVPAGQCVGPAHVTSKPTCLTIFAEAGPPPSGAWYAWMRSTMTQTSGSFPGWAPGNIIGSGWKDTGNPGKQLSPDREADASDTSCPNPGFPSPDDPFTSHPIPNGNVTIHPAQ